MSMRSETHLDRAAMARIIRRAGELADSEINDDAEDTITETSLIAAAEEVGLPVIAVRRSLAAERLGPSAEPQFGDRLVGPAVVAVVSEIAGAADDVLGRVDAWLVQGHH